MDAKEGDTTISQYAFGSRGEEEAESFAAWYAFRVRPNRLSPRTLNTLAEIIPNRIKLYDSVIKP